MEMYQLQNICAREAAKLAAYRARLSTHCRARKALASLIAERCPNRPQYRIVALPRRQAAVKVRNCRSALRQHSGQE